MIFRAFRASWGAPGARESPQEAPEEPRRRPKGGPGRQERPKTPQDSPKSRQERPKRVKKRLTKGLGWPPEGAREVFSSDFGLSGATFWSNLGVIFEALPAAFPVNRLNHRGATGNQRTTTDNARDLP